MNLYNIHEAYEILGLEDPIEYQQKVLEHYIKEIYADKTLEKEYIFKEYLLFFRQTGRTTFKCVDSALRLLKGEDVMFVSHSLRSAKSAEKKIKEYAWILSGKNNTIYSNIGRLTLRSADNIVRFKHQTIGWSGHIISDIY